MGDATMATRYRCNLLDIDRIAAVCVIECDDDAAALHEADRILEKSPCTAAEIWHRTRKVSLVGKRDVA
ncbi:MAG TPA: hypothetical protein VFE34_00925 [Dongiaceae bacterium]|jgi:hypothetical protein|nr:hypothetical protein [Dongiaceae bacterium]